MRIALEEHFIIDQPEHVERWLSTATMIPPAVIEKIQPVLADVGDRRMVADHRLRLLRVDVDPTGDDHVALAVGQIEIAVAIKIADVPK